MSEAETDLSWRRAAPARPYAEVIGDPISHTRSPKIHTFWLDALGIDGEYRAAHVLPEELAEYLAARRADPLWRGCSVTMPHKQAVMRLLSEHPDDALEEPARVIGAVNAVFRHDGGLGGANTDIPGFSEALGGRTFRRVVVVGAGGAARAVLLALRNGACAGHITLQNRDVAKATELLEMLGIRGANGAGDVTGEAVPLGAPLPDGCDLLVNTSALGMVGYPPLLMELGAMAHDGIVYDIVTAPLDTPLLQQARVRGLATIDGLSMLIGQADFAFGHFFGIRPDRSDGDRGLRLALGARPFILGLTGSIGMGKSAVAGMLRDEGVPLFDADAEVHRLQGPGGALLPQIEAAFPGTTGPDGVDRPKLGAAAFGNPEALARLEAMVHPPINAARASFMAEHAAAPLVVFDVPLLFEKGGWQSVDGVAVVSAPAEAQAERVLARPGMTPEKFAQILALQVPDAEKRARADFVIDTGVTLEETRGAVKQVVAGILAGRK